ncbi:hypothetical protein DFJ73DRAFT_791257 [Zopfochytrium polystomum]|nr:hypothetical protein DFJ73DRAFT_791257 [Zopfochytrium polystomum]
MPATPPPARLLDLATTPHLPHFASLDAYKELHAHSIADPDAFWGKMARENLDWIVPFNDACVSSGDFQHGDITWFRDGRLNVSYNCVDRHAAKTPNKPAIIWEPDEPSQAAHTHAITYAELLRDVCRLANVLRAAGVRKGDAVAIYMPMVPEAVVSMLACARLGAVHSVVFAGFSADALRDRVVDADCKVVITADQGKRGGKVVHLKKICDEALAKCAICSCNRTGDSAVPFSPPRDVWWHEEMAKHRPYCPPEPVSAEDPLFMLYTSGSTGKPKGVVHTSAGYLLGVLLTTKYIFDLHEGDVHGCMADVGWITGHSYIVYGPLSNGVTTVVFESVPTYPTPSRYWQTVEKHKITQLYTAPTAIRALRRLGDDHVTPYSMPTLRVLGSVGEPINPEAWHWYSSVVGRNQCAVTGSIVVTPLPGAIPTKPGAATLPFFGIDLAVLDPVTGKELTGNNVAGVLAIRKPFPSIARTVHGDHARYLDTYMRPYQGYYFTGDGVARDGDGYYWIRGRVDDVINVAGHRMSTAEIESALIMHPACAESAVIGIPDDVTGQAVVCFCTLKSHHADTSAVATALRQQVRNHIGPFATPKAVVVTVDLPKTRSGKIMRRVLRKVAAGDVGLEDVKDEESIRAKLGDLSTLADPSVISELVQRVKEAGL